MTDAVEFGGRAGFGTGRVDEREHGDTDATGERDGAPCQSKAVGCRASGSVVTVVRDDHDPAVVDRGEPGAHNRVFPGEFGP